MCGKNSWGEEAYEIFPKNFGSYIQSYTSQ